MQKQLAILWQYDKIIQFRKKKEEKFEIKNNKWENKAKHWAPPQRTALERVSETIYSCGNFVMAILFTQQVDPVHGFYIVFFFLSFTFLLLHILGV